ncbi:nephronectin-like [Mugil cephalus]|uniref:nephronectin-like n=1 Tax=Mugil cephalus TaxID=48193 RepID=UPI001FB58200|nr:nephronectin-like [Mugil cephalus]
MRIQVLLSWLCMWTWSQRLDHDSWDGLCRYGNSVECCWGWRRMDEGRCGPVCPQGCKHGHCLGADRCECRPGYTGKACNQGNRLHGNGVDLIKINT